MQKPTVQPRRIEFIGNHKNDSIVIGNYGDVRFIAQGNFDLSGLIYCGKSTVELNVSGDGMVSFSGICKKLMIRGVDGNCRLDLTNLSSQSVWCESIKGSTVIDLGRTKLIELISLDNEAIVRYPGKPLLLNYSLKGNSKIEALETLYA